MLAYFKAMPLSYQHIFIYTSLLFTPMLTLHPAPISTRSVAIVIR